MNHSRREDNMEYTYLVSYVRTFARDGSITRGATNWKTELAPDQANKATLAAEIERDNPHYHFVVRDFFLLDTNEDNHAKQYDSSYFS